MSTLQDEILQAAKSKDNMWSRVGEMLGITGRHVAKQAEAIEQLRRRVELLEASRFDYVGIHEEHKAYRSGEVVTRGGGLWLAQRETSATPGTNGSGWVLVVKRGAYDLR